MKTEIVSVANYKDLVYRIIREKVDTFSYGIAEKMLVIAGDNVINEEYCNVNNIQIWRSPTNGGCIVMSEGDLELDLYRHDGWNDGEKLSKVVLEKLRQYIPEIILDGNDFMIANYKVGSFSSKNVSNDDYNFIFTGLHLSFSVDVEVIRNICTKEMKKIPKGLSEYNVNREDVLNYIKERIDNVL